MADFYIVQGDTAPVLTATLLAPIPPTGVGAPAGPNQVVLAQVAGGVDLTGASVLFHMATQRGRNKINRAATIDTAASGWVHYTWQTGDTSNAGALWLAQFVVTFASGAVERWPTIPLEITIARQLATT